jgi:hypothetical protein
MARGEISPALYGRVDTAAYQVALRKARNVVIHPYGGASGRDGTRYLEPCKDHTETGIIRLIPFSFKTSDQYMLEFGHNYMRVMRDGGHVLDTGSVETITGITNANPAVVTVSSPTSFIAGEEIFIQGVVGMTEVNGRRYIVANPSGSTFELTNQITGANIDSTGFGVYGSVGTATSIFELLTPYDENDLFDIVHVQSADVMTLTHKSYAPAELARLDHDVWTLTDIDFADETNTPDGITVTVNTTGTETRDYTVAAVDANGQESLSGFSNTTVAITGATQADPVEITATAHGFPTGTEVWITGVVGMTEINDRRFIITSTGANTFTLDNENGTGHTAYSSAGTVAPNFVRVTNSATAEDNDIDWTAVTGIGRYAIYRRDNGLWGLIGEATTNTFLDDDFAPDTGEAPTGFANPFQLNNNPGAVTFYEQRRVFGGSTENPDTSWFSQTGRINTFSVRSPTVADDAITATLTSREVNEIRQYVPGDDLVVLTSGTEWRITAGSDAVLAPDTIQQKPQTNWGSSTLPPLEIDQTILFVPGEYNNVRSLGFSLQLDGYSGSDLMLFAEHLLENDLIRDWALSLSPEPRIHIVLESGDGLTFTFDQEQEVLAWTTWDTDGFFESTAALRGSGRNGIDTVYYVVRRFINGGWRRFIEAWQQRHFAEVEDAFYLDAGSTWDVPVTPDSISLADPIVITDADHTLSDGDFVDFEDFVWESDFDADFNETQPDQLNGRRFVVANSTATTFELENANGDAINGSTYNALVTLGVYRQAVSALVGLDHLEGENVVALTDGNVVSSMTVTNGGVTLPRPSTRIQIGLRYISDIQTLDIETPQGTTQGQKKKVNSVNVRFRRSRGLLIGPDSDMLNEMKQREFEKMGEPTALLTGDKKIDIPPEWNSNGRVFLRQKDPLPITVLAIIPVVTPGDEEE